MKRQFLPFLTLLAFVAFPSSGAAQEHAVSPEALDAIAVQHGVTIEAERAELQAFLQRPEVRRIAADVGIDVGTTATAVASLSAEEITELSGRLTQAEAALAGGDQVVISTTAIILSLLVLIIILVA